MYILYIYIVAIRVHDFFQDSYMRRGRGVFDTCCPTRPGELPSLLSESPVTLANPRHSLSEDSTADVDLEGIDTSDPWQHETKARFQAAM